MPVKKIAGIRLRPVAVARHPRFATCRQISEAALIRSLSHRDIFQRRVWSLRVAPRVAVGSPLDMEKAPDLIFLLFERFLIFQIRPAIPTRPDRWRIHIRNIAGKSAATK